jgi:hypothetical protein
MAEYKQKTSVKKENGTVYIFLTFLFLLLGGIVLAVCVGKYPVTPSESIRVLWQRLFGLPSEIPR